MIIDMRCRLTTAEAATYFRTMAKNLGSCEANRALAAATIEALIQEIGDAGITTAVSVSGNSPSMKVRRWVAPRRTTSNDLMAEMQRTYWGRVGGVAGIDAGNVVHNAVNEIERCYHLGLRAVFIEPMRSPVYYLDDCRLYPIYEKCVERDVALILQSSGPLGGKTIEYVHPKYLDQVADDFPELRIIVGHGCYPYVREAIVVTSRRENVYISPDMYLLQLGTEDWIKAVNSNFLDFQDQFLFGSSYPGVTLKSYVEAFFKLPWKSEALPKIHYRNALRALKLETNPTFKAMYKLD